MTPEELFVQAAVRKDLLSASEGAEVLAAALESSRDVATVLVERGVLTERTVATLRRDVAKHESSAAAAPTEFVPPPADPDATVAVDPNLVPGTPITTGDPKQLGEFEVVARLGQGGMGTVYRARQTSLDRAVAIKVISSQIASDVEVRQRFLREAKVAASINHPHVITIHQVGEDQGRIWMAMELVTGGDAADLVDAEGGVLPEQRALELVRDACKGLVAIEAAGLIHRDIKPANLFLTADGSAKLADLGMARSQAGDDKVTQSGVIVGTPAYMSPEQAEGESCDIRTDVYALGATLYRLCVGHPPYEGSSALRVLAKVLSDPVPDPRKENPKLSVATSTVIRRCLAKKPEQRYPTAAALLGALQGALGAPGAAPKGSMGVQPCALLILFLFAGCSLCTGLFSFLGAQGMGKSVREIRSAKVVTPEELASATGRVFLERVRVEPGEELVPGLVHDGEGYLLLDALTRSPDQMEDNNFRHRVAHVLRVGDTRAETSETTEFHGQELIEIVPDGSGGETFYEGIPFSRAVSVLGEMRSGKLECVLITTEATRAELIERQSSGAGPSWLFGFLCTILGLVGLGLCVMLARRR